MSPQSGTRPAPFFEIGRSRIRSRKAAKSASYSGMQQNAMNIKAKLVSYSSIHGIMAAESASYTE